MCSGEALPTRTRVWVVQNHAEGQVKLSKPYDIDKPDNTFALRMQDLSTENTLPEGTLLVQTLAISNDPAQRLFIDKFNGSERSDMKSLDVGTPMHAYALSKVLVVGGGKNDEKFKIGDLVTGRSRWAEYAVLEKDKVQIVQRIPGLSPTVWLGALGLSGLTAYWGLMGACDLKESHTLVVSGAAGSVGNVAVQYAKKVLKVRRVIGIAGSNDKCNWLKTIGADDAINYKSASFAEDLMNATPDGVDVFLDNVAGWILDAVLKRMNIHGTVVCCGMISRYGGKGEKGLAALSNYETVLLNRIRIQGYSVIDHVARFEESTEALAEAVKSGNLIIEGAETVVDLRNKFDEIPRVWAGLFEGVNTGKLITKLASSK